MTAPAHDNLGPIDARLAPDILAHAPFSLYSLPEFFDRLTDEQLDAGWVVCVIAIVTADRGRVEVAALAAALTAVRDRSRARLAGRRHTPTGGLRPRSAHRPTRAILDAVLASLPKPGECVNMNDAINSGSERNKLRIALAAGVEPRLRYEPSVRGAAPARIRRISA